MVINFASLLKRLFEPVVKIGKTSAYAENDVGAFCNVVSCRITRDSESAEVQRVA